jgi:plasmid stabilization system protein ParE
MSVPVILRDGAAADIQQIHGELEEIRPGLGRQFADRLREVLENIENQPELHGIIWKDVRAVRLRRFQYVLYYVAFAERVEVIAVIHGARRSSLWRKRH